MSACFVVLLAPRSVAALTLVQITDLFNIFAGLMLTMSILLFFGGLGVYFTRLGTWPSDRDLAIKIMEWGVSVLFVLIVILAIVQFFQNYPKVATTVVGTIVALAILGLVIYVAANTGSKKKEKE